MLNIITRQNIITVFILALLVGQTVYAERKTFTFSADNTFANLAEGQEYTVLRGNAIVTADDVRITAGEIFLYGDDFQFAEVKGTFSALDLKNDFSLEGDRLFYDRTIKLLRAEGNIVMKDNQNDVVIRAHFLESKNDGDFMVVQLGVRITKKEELSARTEFLTYYRRTEILEMTGFPFALWKDDEYRANRVSINLDTDEVTLEGKVQGFISTVQEEEEDNNAQETSNTDTGDSSQQDGEQVNGENEQEDASQEIIELDSQENTGEGSTSDPAGNGDRTEAIEEEADNSTTDEEILESDIVPNESESSP